jgi:RES domain
VAEQYWFRNVDPRYPFLWASSAQPPARWHAENEGPAQYLADTPEGAWAEFLRHEEISDIDDLAGVARDLWALPIELSDEASIAEPALAGEELRGGLDSYSACREEARRLRDKGASALIAPSAALVVGGAYGELVDLIDLVPAHQRDGRVLVLFGARPEQRGHHCVERGRPPERVLSLTVPLS